jgi:preprotein translocase subunit SecG
MNAAENHKRIQELRRIGFQRLFGGVAIVFGVGCICYIFLDEGDGAHFHSSYSSGRGLGLLLLIPAYGFWNIVRGVIHLIRAQSSDEHYGKGVEDAMDDFQGKQEELMSKKMGNGSMHNVLVLLVWIFLFLAVVGAIGVGYLFWTRP